VKDDASLHDEQLESEIRLVGDLVLAASQREGHMSQAEIDEILGLEGEPPDDDALGDVPLAAPGDLPVQGADDALPPGSKAS
jgi:hypothetical protein